MFGILISNCYVTDGVNKRAEVIDSRGCPIDPILITGIRYSSDLQRAYAESQVFKFADRPGVWFFCQIQMCMKKEGMCEGITPPGCATTSPPPRGIRRPVTVAPSGTRGRARVSTTPTAISSEEESGGQDETLSGNDTSGTVQATNVPERLDYDATETTTARARPRGSVASPRPPGLLNSDYESNGGGTDTPFPNQEEGQEAGSRPEYTTTTPSTTTARFASHRKSGNKNFRGPAPPRNREPGSSSNPYNQVQSPSTIEYEDNENGEPQSSPSKGNTVFGPAFSPDSAAYGQSHRKIFGAAEKEERDTAVGPPQDNPYGVDDQTRRSQVISTDFETKDDLPRDQSKSSNSTPLTTATDLDDAESSTTSDNTKKDYVDYDSDVTIPPHLTDLLAHLQPQDINADNLQKMFRDSVADRRALLQGFDLLIHKMKKGDHGAVSHRPVNPLSAQPSKKTETRRMMPGDKIDTMQISWDSHRLARDSPLAGSSSLAPPPSFLGDASEPPMIAGQLLIYDLDETPPPLNQEKLGATSSDQCTITKNGFFFLAIGMASLTAALLVVTMTLFLKLKGAKGVDSENKRTRERSSQPAFAHFDGVKSDKLK